MVVYKIKVTRKGAYVYVSDPAGEQVVYNPANFEDVQQLKAELELLRPFFETYSITQMRLKDRDYHLGDMQQAYSALYTTCRDYSHFVEQDYNRKKNEATKAELKVYLASPTGRTRNGGANWRRTT